MSIFGDETIPVPGESPEGHDEPAAVETESETEIDNEEVDSEQDQEDEESSGNPDSDADDDQLEHSEELLAGKYKSTADLVKGYKELERQFHQQRNGGGQQQQSGNQEPAIQSQSQPAQQQDPNTVFWERFRENPMATIQSLVQFGVTQQTAPLHEERQAEILGRNFEAIAKEFKQVATEEGMKQMGEKIREIAADLGNPGLINNPSPRVLRMAAQEAFGDTKAQAFKKGKDAARADAERARQSKQGLGTKGGAKQQSAPEMSEDERMKAGILAAGRGGGLFG